MVKCFELGSITFKVETISDMLTLQSVERSLLFPASFKCGIGGTGVDSDEDEVGGDVGDATVAALIEVVVID